MTSHGYAVPASPQFTILSERQLEQIHFASLEILWRTGSRLFSAEGLALLTKAGASVSDGNRVRLPPHLVEWALRCAPPRVVLGNRNGERAMFLEDHRTYFGPGSDCPNIYFAGTGERRRYLKDDVADAARLCDSLPNIDFVMSMGLASDVSAATSDRHQFEAMVLNTVKPIVFTAHDLQGLIDIVEMASAAVGSREALLQNLFIVLYAEPSTPLQHTRDAVDKLLYMAENHLPVIYAPGMLVGATAPVTLAGCLALANAESLFGLVLAQLKREGAPFIYGGGALPFDMRTSVAAYGGPELQKAGVALAQMAHRYALPRFSGAGASDSKVLDEQAMIEGSLSIVLQALYGANLVHDVGYLEGGLTSCYEMLFAMDEVISMVKYLLNGVEIDDKTLALDVIDKVGPGGNFLTEDHTLKFFRKGWFPRLMDRQSFEAWSGACKTMGERLSDRVRQVLGEYAPPPLPARMIERVRSIVAAAEHR